MAVGRLPPFISPLSPFFPHDSSISGSLRRQRCPREALLFCPVSTVHILLTDVE